MHTQTPEARQRLIEQQLAGIHSADSPGGSWQLLPGRLPPSRTMPKSPDKSSAVGFLTPARKKLLHGMRYALHARGGDRYPTLVRAFSQFDQYREGRISADAFFRAMKELGAELDADKRDVLCMMFACAGGRQDSSDPHAQGRDLMINYDDFIYTFFEATAGTCFVLCSVCLRVCVCVFSVCSAWAEQVSKCMSCVPSLHILRTYILLNVNKQPHFASW